MSSTGQANCRRPVASAAGWNQEIHDIETTAGPLVFLYAYDLPTQWTWMCSISREMFSRMLKEARQLGEVEAVRSGVAQLTASVAKGDLPPDVHGMTWEQQLCALLVAYAASTQVLQIADNLHGGGHFVVLHYRKKNVTNGLLRPFAAPDTNNSMLPVTRLMESVSRVIELDQGNNPQWFL